MREPQAVVVAAPTWYERAPRWTRRALILSVGAGFITQALLVVSGILVARTLGVADRGHLALLVVIATALAFVGTAGVPDALAYYISRERSAARTLARRVTALAGAQVLVLCVVQTAILAALVHNEPSEIKVAAAITLGCTPIFIAYQYGMAVLQAERRFVALSVLRVVPVASYSALAVTALAIHETTVPAFALAWLVSYVLAGSGAVVLAARATRGAIEPSKATVREIAGFGARGFVGQVSFAESFRVDQLVAGLFLGPVPLGLYAVASAFTTLPMVVAMSVGMVEYPHVASEPDRQAARRTVVRYLVLTLVLCTVIVAAVEAVIPTLLPWLFGADFAPAVPVARILVLAGVALAGRRILSDGLRALGHPAAGTFAELVSWAVLVPLLALLAPLYGITGVAAAVMISAGVGAVFLGVALVRSRAPEGRDVNFADPDERAGEVARRSQAQSAGRAADF